MTTGGKKPIFSFLTFALFITFLVGLCQTLLQWSEPVGWFEQWNALCALEPATLVALGLTILGSFACLAFGLLLLIKRRRLLYWPRLRGMLALVFAGALAYAPETPTDIMLYVTCGALLLVIVLLKITAVLERRKLAAPQSAAKAPPRTTV